MKNERQLKNMSIEEVSLVDKPANKRKFLLIKREDGEITELTIKSDGTADGTSLSVNGVEATDLKSFWFSLWPSNDFDEGTMSGTYTVNEMDGAEFDRETTFSLKKGMNTMKLETLLKALGRDPKSLSEEEAKNVSALLKYVDMVAPEDAAAMLDVAKAYLAKEEVPAEEQNTEETPNEADEMASAKVAEIQSAMAQLNGMLPESDRIVINSEEPSDLQLILAAIEKRDKPAETDSTENSDAPVTIDEIMKRLVKVEETTGNSPDDDTEGDEVADPDVPLAKEERFKKYGTLYPKARASWGTTLLQNSQ